jgi:5-aminolevulinate synthase
VFSDERNHELAGTRNSRAEKHIFRHNDPADLAQLLASIAPERPKLVCFESVYSMDCDIAPIGELCDVADRFGVVTYLDECIRSGSTTRVAAASPNATGSCTARRWRSEP